MERVRRGAGYVMSYVRSEDGTTVTKWPYRRSDFRVEYPNSSIPASPTDAQYAEFGVYPVMDMAQPAYDPLTHTIVEIDPTWSGSQWDQQWSVIPLSSAEQLAARYDGEKADILTDSFVDTFINMTPAQVENYIETNVTNLDSSKNVLKKMGKMLLLLARREFS